MARVNYEGPHRRLAETLRPYAAGRPCARCGGTMLPGEPIHLDHADDGVGYVNGDPLQSFSHARCNTSAGGRKGAAVRQQRRNYMRMQTTNAAFGIEISEDRSHTSVVCAEERKDVVVVTMAGYLVGSDTAGTVYEFLARQTKPRVVVDPRSHAATLLEPLKEMRLQSLTEPSPHEVAVAHGLFLDELRAGRVKHVEHEVLTAAIKHAAVRPLVGALALSRRTEVDASPAVAAELAVWGLLRVPVPRAPRIH